MHSDDSNKSSGNDNKDQVSPEVKKIKFPDSSSRLNVKSTEGLKMPKEEKVTSELNL